jgi:Raf kinase inhibitor-like YbhB/YbcL family protein
MRTAAWIGGALPLALALALSGCGGGSSTSTSTTSTTIASGSGVSSQAALASGETVATVDRTPIAKATFAHWLAVTTALSGSSSQGTGSSGQALKDRVLGFLISSQWLLAEAAAEGISVSEAAVHKRLAEVQSKQFKKPAELQKYLAKSGETQADLLLRIKLELLESAISQRVTAAKHTAAEKRAVLTSFQEGFQKKWKAKTSCGAGYVMEDCKEYKGALAAPGSSSSSGASSSSSASSSSAKQSSSTNASSNASGETYSAPGSLALSSPAFERNGAIPAQYTCAGANVSPPLAWQNVPAHTAELVLFMIDDSSSTTAGGIRWVVAGIEPSLRDVKAGSVPAGAVVGRNTAGTVGYSGICPAHGKTDNIEFVLYALRKKISLTNGFTPAVAESKYGGSELGSATTYASYTRA